MAARPVIVYATRIAFMPSPRWQFARSLRPSRRPLLWSGLFLALVIVVVMWREILAGGMLLADDIWVSDLLNNNVPPRAFLGQSLRRGQFPLWMPGSYGGLALVPQGEAAATSPITWVLYTLFDRVTATTLSVALHTWIAGFGTVLAARRFGARTLAATAAGVAFMLCGFLVEHLKHMNMHHAAAFLPWMLYALDRLRESPSPKTALAFAALAALQLTEGHPQMCYVGAFALAPILVYRVLTARRKGPPGRLAYALRLGPAMMSSALVALVLSGAYLVAGHELYKSSERAAETIDRWEFCTRYGFEWENILTLGWAHVFGNGANATYNPRHGIFWESWLYAGTVPVLAAFVALLAGARHALARRFRIALPVLVWALLAGLAFALMLGKRSPVYAFAFHFVPGMTWFRFPQRFALVLEVAVIFLGAMGLDAITKNVERSFGKRKAIACAALLLAITTGDMAYYTMGHFHAIPRAAALKPPPTVKALQGRAPAEPWRFLSIFGPEAHVEAFNAARGWQRWRPYEPQWAILQPSTHLYWDLPAIGGYTSMVPEGVGKVLGSHNAMGLVAWPRTHWAERPKDCPKDPKMSGKCRATARCAPHMAKAYGAFNVRFLVSPLELDRCAGWKLLDTIKADPFEVRVYENEHVLPRAYVVGDVLDVANLQEAAGKLLRGNIDPARRASRLGGAPAKTPPKLDKPYRACQYEERAPGSRRIQCDLETPGYLIVADTYERGTEIRVDGARVEPFLAHAIQIGVELPAGQHEITVDFRPRYRHLVFIGALGWAVLCALALRLALPKRL